MYQKYVDKLRAVLDEQDVKVCLFSGFRQVGKTTAVSHLLRKIDWNYYVVNAESKGNVLFWTEQVIHTAKLKFNQDKERKFLLVIDDFNKFEHQMDVIQSLVSSMSEIPSIKILLVGTSGPRLQQFQEEITLENFKTIRMGHTGFNSTQIDFGLSFERHLYFGAYPSGLEMMEEEDRWRHFIKQNVIEQGFLRDVLSQSRVDKPNLIRQLFDLGIRYNGQIVALNKLMRELPSAGNTSTLSHYLDTLESAGLLGRIEKYTGEQNRIRASKPKLLLFTSAILTATQDTNLQQILFDYKEWFKVIHAALGAHLLNGAFEQEFELYYWQDGEHYVDFVLKKGTELVAIELKGERFGRNKGLENFKAQFKPTKSFLIGTGGISLEEFISMSPVELF
jgi:uncharacterized protein